MFLRTVGLSFKFRKFLRMSHWCSVEKLPNMDTGPLGVQKNLGFQTRYRTANILVRVKETCVRRHQSFLRKF